MKTISFVFVVALAFAAFGCKKQGVDCAKAIDNSMAVSKATMEKMPGMDAKTMDKMKDLGVQYEAGVRFHKPFFDENRDFAVGLAKLLGRPILIEMWDERFFYFVMKFEFNVVDTMGKAAALSTVQIDVENCERFDITYTGQDGQKKTRLQTQRRGVHGAHPAHSSACWSGRNRGLAA